MSHCHRSFGTRTVIAEVAGQHLGIRELALRLIRQRCTRIVASAHADRRVGLLRSTEIAMVASESCLSWRCYLHVLFVCTGNICRSPTAERLAIAMAESLEINNFVASSAGTHALVGHPIHSNAIPVLEGLGGSAENFRARQLTPRIALSADLILTMTRRHRDAVLERAPQRLHQTFTIAEAARIISDAGAVAVANLSPLRSQIAASEALDVLDPIGQGTEVFVEIGQRIADLLVPIISICRDPLAMR